MYFIHGFIETTICFLLFGAVLAFRVFRPAAWMRFLDAEEQFCRRLGIPASWFPSFRRFDRGRGFVVSLACIVAVFFLLMIANLAALVYFTWKLRGI